MSKQQKNIDALLNNLSSFIKENLPKDSMYEKYLEAVLGSAEIFNEQIKTLRDNTEINSAHTLRTIAFSPIDISSALYTKQEALKWQHFSVKEMVEHLEEMGKCVQFEFLEMTFRKPVVYSMDLFEKENQLSVNKDYVIRRNKLFLLPSFILRNYKQTTVLQGKKIKVHDFTLEKNWGIHFPLEVPVLIPRHQYRLVLEAYNQMMHSNFFIKDIELALRYASGHQEVNIMDTKSRALPAHLRLLYDTWKLSPADFIVRIGEEMSKNKVMINILLHMLANAHEVQTFFWLFFMIAREDDILTEDEAKFKVFTHIEDSVDMISRPRLTLTYDVVDDFFYHSPYDTDVEHDIGSKYDIPGYNDNGYTERVVMDNATETEKMVYSDLGRSKHTEQVLVNVVTYPEIPRGFSVKSGVINFEKKSDYDGLVDVYASETLQRDSFEKIHTIDLKAHAVGQVSYTIPVEFKGKMRYYKIRAREGDATSLFSLTKEAN